MNRTMWMKTILGFLGLMLVLSVFYRVLVQVLVATPATYLPTEVEILDDETVKNITEPQLVSFERLIEFVDEEFDYDEIVSVNLRFDRQPVVFEVLLRMGDQTHLIEIDGYRLSILRRKIRNLYPQYNDDDDDDDDDEDDDDEDDEDDDDDEDEDDDE
jgi:hypothetical protein